MFIDKRLSVIYCTSSHHLTLSPATMEKLYLEVPQFKESRLPSLYSDFSHLKDINPEGYQANHDSWVALLYASLRLHTFGTSVSLPGEKLSSTLRNSVYGEPKMLATTLDEQIKKGDWIPWSIYRSHNLKGGRRLTDFLSPRRIGNALWGSVALNFYSLRTGLTAVASDHFIAWSSLVSIGDRVYTELKKRVDKENGVLSAKLFDENLFNHTLKEIDSDLSDIDIQVLMVYLSRDTGQITLLADLANSEKTFIKVGDSTPITEEEIGVIKLKSNVRNMEEKVHLFEEQLNEKIPEKLANLVKTKATEDRLRNVLIRKAALKKSLSRASNVCMQLSLVLDKINEAKSNADLFQTLKESKAVLSLLNKQVSLEDVDSVAAELDDEIATTNEVSNALLLSTEVDEDEIESELAEIEKEVSGKEASVKKESSEDLIERLQNINIEQNELTTTKDKKAHEPDGVESNSEKAVAMLST